MKVILVCGCWWWNCVRGCSWLMAHHFPDFHSIYQRLFPISCATFPTTPPQKFLYPVTEQSHTCLSNFCDLHRSNVSDLSAGEIQTSLCSSYCFLLRGTWQEQRSGCFCLLWRFFSWSETYYQVCFGRWRGDWDSKLWRWIWEGRRPWTVGRCRNHYFWWFVWVFFWGTGTGWVEVDWLGFCCWRSGCWWCWDGRRGWWAAYWDFWSCFLSFII